MSRGPAGEGTGSACYRCVCLSVIGVCVCVCVCRGGPVGVERAEGQQEKGLGLCSLQMCL